MNMGHNSINREIKRRPYTMGRGSDTTEAACAHVSPVCPHSQGPRTFHHEAARTPCHPEWVRGHAGVGPGVRPTGILDLQAAVLQDKHSGEKRWG